MKNHEDLICRINDSYQKMSKGQKLIAEYILNNYDKAAFMTASKLGSTIGVSESTVVRFASILDYEGYPALQKALQELIRNKLTMVQRIELSSDIKQVDLWKNVLKADINNIKHTINELEGSGVFDRVVDKILNADRIYILGLRSAAPLANFLGYYLNFIFENVVIVTSGVNDVFEQLMHLQSNDVLIGISFPRYARRAIEAMKFSKEKGAQTIAITDSDLSPLTNYANEVILARSNMASFVDSLVAPLSVINALIVMLGMKKKTSTANGFFQLEKIWDEYKVYVNKERY